MPEKTCSTCQCNKVCDHNKYGFENCGNYIYGDVVEVVRCKDCKYRKTPDCKMWYHCVICGYYHHWEKDEYYCSYGKRTEDK